MLVGNTAFSSLLLTGIVEPSAFFAHHSFFCGTILCQTFLCLRWTGQYGTDSSCADNCCRFNCCWKNGALPVEDYPIANSSADDGTQTVDGGVDGTKEDTEAGSLPAYTATPQMSASAAATAPTDTKTTAEQQTSQP